MEKGWNAILILNEEGQFMDLYTKEMIENRTIEPWKQDAFETFAAKIADQDQPFPCIPATIGQRLNHFRYGFVSNLKDGAATNQLADLLEAYSKCYQEIGSYTSLIIFYEPCGKMTEKVEIKDYEQFFWAQLNRVVELDKIDWPSNIPQDPHHRFWEFCFHGEQYFMYCATPAHKKRRSRNFPYFMLAITPRWALERFILSEKNAAKIKASIRKRLENYDSIPIHPALNTYGNEDNYEWKQYFLHDDNTSLPQCPFHPKPK
jgi:FPC/CPF motif-containing protein YcgG